MPRTRNPFPLTALGLLTLFTGCGVGLNGGGAGGSSVTPALHLSGKVFGGQQPVSGATMQLYTVGTTGVGSASTPLISTTVVSDANGNFSITGQYSCTAATQVYITATGGNSGTGVNPTIALMASLGSCSTLLANAATTYITMNELTTVAAVYALAPFMTDMTHIGATGSNPPGLLNAFAVSSLLVNTSIGQIVGGPTGISLPSTRLNTVADILAACVNTSSASSTQCTTLYNGTGAGNTVNAAVVIAKNPGASNILSLFGLSTSSPPFVPGLTVAPSDFTLAITYTGTELLAPFGIAIDSGGNAWVTNEAGRSVTKLPALSASFATQTYSVGGLLSPRGLSIDRTGFVWIANTGGNSVVKLSSAGAAVSGSGFTAGNISSPVAIANDSAGNAWVANFGGNSVTELAPGGAASNTLTASISMPTGIALDAAGNVAVANAGTGTVCLFSNAGVAASCPTDGTLFGPTAVAISSGGALAEAGSTTGATLGGAFTLGTSAGAINSASPVAGGGLTLPVAVVYDSAGTAWFANTASISAFKGATAVTPAAGYGSLNSPQGIAADGSGNIWTANAGDNSVAIFVGLAAPTVTPLAAAVGP